MAQGRKDLTPPYVYLIRVFRPFPDFDPPFIKPVRQKAVELLDLKKGDRVLDVGCGPGGSFPYLVHASANRAKWSVSRSVLRLASTPKDESPKTVGETSNWLRRLRKMLI
jgi:hypothetical protein